MAYSTASTAVKPGLLTPRMSAGWSTAMYQFGGALWTYTSSDALATVVASSYFIDGYSLGMRKFDHVFHMDTNNVLVSIVTVTSQTSAGNDPRAVTVSSLLTS